jgi:hypothetical protein
MKKLSLLLALTLLILGMLTACADENGDSQFEQPSETESETDSKTESETDTLPGAENQPAPKPGVDPDFSYPPVDPGNEPAADPNSSDRIPTPSLP